MGRFADALRAPGLGAIAEIKRRSPSAGDLRPDADPARIAPAYANAGAAAISVLVDERFAGSWDDLRAARAATQAPLLAKGFFSTADDLRTARESGADAALLLLRDLDDRQVVELLAEAHRLGLDTLVEAHTAAELDRGIAARRAGPRGQRARPRDLRDRPRRTARARVPDSLGPRRHRRVGDPLARSGGRRGACGRGRDPRRLGAHALAGSGGEARRAPLAAARQGLRPDARGRRRSRRGGGRRPPRLRPRSGEPTRCCVRPARPRGDALRRGLGRRGGRVAGRPRSGAHRRGRQGARAATRRSTATTKPSPGCSTFPGARTIPATGSARPARTAGSCSPVDWDRRTSPRRSPRSSPWAVDASSSLETSPGIKDHARVRAYVEAARA